MKLLKNYEEIQQYVFAVNQISYKEQKRKIMETRLGPFWNVLNPFLFMVIMSTYYSKIVPHDIDNFPLFALTGYIVINYFNAATTGSMRSLVDNKKLLIRTKLPIEVFVYQKTLNAFKELLYACLVLIPVMFFFKIQVGIRCLLTIPVLILLTIITVGIGKILAVMYVYFADIAYLYSIFMSLLYFVSAVFIPLDHLPEDTQRILTYNPVFLSIYLSRNCLLYNIPSHYTAWLKLIAWALVTYCLGQIIYIKNRNTIVGKL